MQIKIALNCFDTRGKSEDLDSIYSLVKEQQHHWVDIDLEEIEKTEWFAGLGSRDINDLKKFSVASTRKIRNKLTINISENSILNSDYSIVEAKIFLKQPLSILVENSQYEASFINAIINNFDFDGEIIHAKQQGWLVFENLGGGNNNTIVGKLENSFNHPFLGDDKCKYLRIFVIKDSDRDFCIINDDGTITQQQLPPVKTQFLEENKIPYHYWYKKEKENYMPDSIYEKYKFDRTKKDYINSYLKLNNHQKDFLDIEKGFSYFDKSDNSQKVKDISTLNSRIVILFNNISEEDFQILGMGFTSKYPNFKASFSNEFYNVSRLEMLERIEHQPLIKSEINDIERNEFEHIIHNIKRLL